MTERHQSSCSVYNAPAYEPGPCDCKFKEQNETLTAFAHSFKVYGRSFSEAFDPKLDEALDKAVEAIRMSDQ